MASKVTSQIVVAFQQNLRTYYLHFSFYNKGYYLVLHQLREKVYYLSQITKTHWRKWNRHINKTSKSLICLNLAEEFHFLACYGKWKHNKVLKTMQVLGYHILHCTSKHTRHENDSSTCKPFMNSWAQPSKFTWDIENWKKRFLWKDLPW